MFFVYYSGFSQYWDTYLFKTVEERAYLWDTLILNQNTIFGKQGQLLFYCNTLAFLTLN